MTLLAVGGWENSLRGSYPPYLKSSGTGSASLLHTTGYGPSSQGSGGGGAGQGTGTGVHGKRDGRRHVLRPKATKAF